MASNNDKPEAVELLTISDKEQQKPSIQQSIIHVDQNKPSQLDYNPVDTHDTDEIPPQEEFETENVGFMTSLKWLIYKNFKQQFIRRPCSLTCKIVCPALLTIILGLIRMLVDVEPENIQYASYNPQTTVNEHTIQPENWISNAICYNYHQTHNDSTYTYYSVPYYLSITPNPSSNIHIQGLLDIMNQSWSYHYDEDEFISLTNLHSCDQYAKYIPFKEGWLLRYFNNDDELNKYINSNDYSKKKLNNLPNGTIDYNKPIGTSFSFEVSDDGTKWSWSLRGNTTGLLNVPNTAGDAVNELVRDFYTLYNSGPSQYVSPNKFLDIQTFVDNSITKYIAKINDVNVSNVGYIDNIYKSYSVMPVYSPETDEFWSELLILLFLVFMICSFVYPFSQVVSQLLHEKADKIKEGMKMMGVSTGTFWTSWYLWLFFEMTILALLVAVVGILMDVYKYSNGLIIFIWLWLFCMNFTCLATLISTCFDNPKIASLFSFLLFIVTMFASLYSSTMTETGKNALCLIGPCCFSISINNMAYYERGLIGLQWDNIYDSFQNFTFNTVLVMLFVDCIIYILLTIYFDFTWPSRYGQTLHPLFCISSRVWCPNKTQTDAAASNIFDSLRKQQSTSQYEKDAKYKDATPFISIRRLTKYFTSLFGKNADAVKAVKSISLDIYQGEIFCLLGHNGAGKTTTIGMLTGLLNVTEGDAWINGKSVVSQMREIRKDLGVCPQHDVLFRRLTAKEHLLLFARLKGVPSKYIDNEVKRMLLQSGIGDKANAYPPSLSGGQRRKLSLGIALIGNSKTVFLDEPTSGMDVQARRSTWNMIVREKAKRCIVLTTHFMDEADILGDRIAIMSDGEIRCCGSSLFLKRLYGVGYTFVISLNIGIKPKSMQQELDEIILKNVTNSSVISVAGGEIGYRLPFEETHSFPEMFNLLDTRKNELNIKSYGISITTLEEVFLKIGHDDALKRADSTENVTVEQINDDNEEQKYDQQSNQYMAINQSDDDDSHKNPFPQPSFQLEHHSEFVIFWRHLIAVLYLRVLIWHRDWRSLFCQIVLPVLFALIGIGILSLTTDLYPYSPKLAMNVEQWYPQNQYIMPISQANNIENVTEINNIFTINKQEKYIGLQTKILEYENVEEHIINGHTDFNESLFNFANVLLDERSPQNGILHYNSFFIPEILAPANSGIYPNEHNAPIISVVNVSAKHSFPITFNVLNNWILKYTVRNISNIEPSIGFYSYPLPITKTQQVSQSQFNDYIATLMMSIFLMIALAFIPIGAIFTIVNDKKYQTKHLQLVSGVSCASYWCGNYLADFIASLPAIILLWILMHAFTIEGYIEEQGGFICVLLLYSLAILPFTYIFSYLFSSGDRAQLVVGVCYLIFGMALLMTGYAIQTLVSEKVYDIIIGFFQIFPTYLMAHAIFQIGQTYSIALLNPFADSDINIFEWDVIGKDLTLLAVQAVGYFLLVIVVEHALLYKMIINKWWNKNCKSCNEIIVDELMDEDENKMDDDVEREVNRIKNETVEDKVIISNLHKIYNNSKLKKQCGGGPLVHAVRGVYLGVKQGEVFGYLGVNGAGKTTTLACLTGERSVTFGNAYINGYSISKQISVRRFIGYCPQFDALFGLMTGKEHLKFYGRVKGLKGEELDKQVNMLLKVLSLTEYANRRSNTYSGGNKRKLSVAISMIGNPPIVFLDEPSTGMDPMARRSMWEFIRCTMKGRCVVLTTHSMEECEALCHRLCIMIDGKLQCIGTPQHLKTKFGGNKYQISLTLDNEQNIMNDINIIEQALSDTFNLELIEHNHTKLVYEITSNGDDMHIITLSEIFKTMEEYNKSLPIKSYAVNQSTLEQIFIQMAKNN